MPGTQKLFWKKAKHLWNPDLLAKMTNFAYSGAKDEELKVYQTIEYVERNCGDLTIDGVNEYNQALGTILKWIRLASDARKRDIGRRLVIAKTLREERDAKVTEEETRQATRATELEAAKVQFATDN